MVCAVCAWLVVAGVCMGGGWWCGGCWCVHGWWLLVRAWVAVGVCMGGGWWCVHQHEWRLVVCAVCAWAWLVLVVCAWVAVAAMQLKRGPDPNSNAQVMHDGTRYSWPVKVATEVRAFRCR